MAMLKNEYGTEYILMDNDSLSYLAKCTVT